LFSAHEWFTLFLGILFFDWKSFIHCCFYFSAKYPPKNRCKTPWIYK